MTDLVRVWLVRTDPGPELAERFRAVLDEAESAHMADFLQEPDQLSFAAAHGARRMILGRETGTPPESLTFAVGENGKPEAAGAPYHSMSASGGLALIAVSRHRPVGVDVQQLGEGLDPVALSARYFLPFEARYVAGGHDPQEQTDRYARLWTRKEAVVKAVGGRVWANLRAAVLQRDLVACVDPPGPYRHRVLPVEVPPGYRAAVALFGEAAFSVEEADFEV